MIVLQLPYPPSVWNLYRGWGKNRNKSEEYKLWLNEAGLEILRTPAKHRQPILDKFTMTVLAGRPDKRGRDLDNLLKAPADLLQSHGLISNDHKAESITIAWSPKVEKRRIEVRVWPWCAERAALAAMPVDEMIPATTGQGRAA